MLENIITSQYASSFSNRSMYFVKRIFSTVFRVAKIYVTNWKKFYVTNSKICDKHTITCLFVAKHKIIMEQRMVSDR